MIMPMIVKNHFATTMGIVIGQVIIRDTPL